MTAPSQSVRVRIAVVVNDKGQYTAFGANGCDDEDALHSATDCADWLDEGSRERTYFVEATLALPTRDKPTTVEGAPLPSLDAAEREEDTK